jgi:hypothetical protein
MQSLLTTTGRRWTIQSLICFALIAAACAFLNPLPNAIAKVFDNQSAENQSQDQGSNEQRLREGTKVEKLTGHFKLTGDRVTFFTANSKQRIGGLENLALERIARTVNDSPTQLRWVVSGVITEYRGTNYLLVTHAMLTEEDKHFDGR